MTAANAANTNPSADEQVLTAPETPTTTSSFSASSAKQMAADRVSLATKKLGNPWLLAALLLAGLASWQWFNTRQQLHQQQGLEKRLADSDLAAQEYRSQAKQAQEQVQAIQNRLAALETRLENNPMLAQGAQSAFRDIATDRDLSLLVEVEHALVLAHQQLQTNLDAPAFLNTLQAIDLRLAKTDRAQFSGIRKAIAREIELLRKIPANDFAGMNQRLENLLAGVDQLPLSMDARPAQSATSLKSNTGTEEAPWVMMLNGLWSEIRGLIRIERIDGKAPALISADQQFFVRENLKLRLLGARLALMARDKRSYQHELEACQSLLVQYFNSEDKTVQNTHAALKQFVGTPIQIDLPNLGESLSVIRQTQQSIEKKNKP